MPSFVVASSEVLDEGVSGDDDACGAISLQSPHRPKSGLEASVVGLEQIVRMDLHAVEGCREQLIKEAGVDPVPVGGDLGG